MDRLEKLKEQRSQIEARIRDLEARRRAEERKRDTRRKVLAGALALEHAERDPAFGEALSRLLRDGLTRPGDRELFGLDPLPDEAARVREPT